MRFSYGKFGGMKPKVAIFKCGALTPAWASEKTIRKVDAWFAEKGKQVKVYRMRAVTKKSWLGLWATASFYIFYKDIPQ